MTNIQIADNVNKIENRKMNNKLLDISVIVAKKLMKI